MILLFSVIIVVSKGFQAADRGPDVLTILCLKFINISANPMLPCQVSVSKCGRTVQKLGGGFMHDHKFTLIYEFKPIVVTGFTLKYHLNSQHQMGVGMKMQHKMQPE